MMENNKDQKNKKRITLQKISYLLVVLFLIMVVYVLVSLFSEEDSQQVKENYDITFVNPITGHPYWEEVSSGIEKICNENNINFKEVGPEVLSIDEQATYLERAILEKSDGIITAALDSEVFTPLIAQAKEMNIPLVLVDSDAPESERLCYVGTNNYSAGKIMGNLVGKIAGKDESVIGIISGYKEATNLQERKKGLLDSLNSYSNITLGGIVYDDTDFISASAAAKKLIEENPKINIICGLESNAASGIGNVIKQNCLEDTIKVVSFDTLKETLDLLGDGIILATIKQNPKLMGEKAVEVLLDFIKNGNTPPSCIDTGVTILTKENIDNN